MKSISILVRLTFSALSLLLAACSEPSPPAPPTTTKTPLVLNLMSFDCESPQTVLQSLVCQNEMLAALDREMARTLRKGLGTLDLFGRAQLLADQRRWLLRRQSLCRLPVAEHGVVPLGAADCLKDMYQARIAELVVASARPQEYKRPGRYPISTYVEFRLAEDTEPALCAGLGTRFNEALVAFGQIDPSRIHGFTELAGTHGPSSFMREGHTIDVPLYEAGPYASYQLRAQRLVIDGKTFLDENSLLDWTARMPNSGGRPNRSSSGTSDYAAIDVFRVDERDFVLVTDTWGYYAAVPTGESSHAGLYELVQGKDLQPRCLYRTYLIPPMPPEDKVFDSLPAVKKLENLLLAMAGKVPAGLAQLERLDEWLFKAEMQWTLLNMPLLALDEVERFDRKTAWRRRHNVALETIFAWSERNLPSKLLYRRLLPALQPAHDEMVRAFLSTQGLRSDQAAAAADLLLMVMVDHAAENLAAVSPAVDAAASSGYTRRYAVVPALGDLEKNRRYANLHSALLNRAPPDVIAEFIRIEADMPTGKLGRGAAGDTALMVAVRSPEVLPQLLAVGANPNAYNDWHKTALMTAAQFDQYESAQLLLAAGADVQRATIVWQSDGAGGPDNHEGATGGRTALMYAAASAHAPLLRLLLEHGAPVDARDGAGHTACHYLAQNKVLKGTEREELRSALCANMNLSQ